MTINEFYERYWELIKFRGGFRNPKIVLNAWDDDKTIFKTDTFKVYNQTFHKYENPSVLDIGAGSRRFYKTMQLMDIEFEYMSLDISNGAKHDYSDINDVKKTFDIITMFELIEHLPLTITLQYFSKVYEILKPNGLLIVSTPNIDHINQLWKHDVTHIQQYPAKDIYSILRMIGFTGEIDIYRINLKPLKMSLKKSIIEKLRVILNKILGTDYAHGVLLIAKKT